MFYKWQLGAHFHTISMATIICTVECTFHLTIDVKSLKTFIYLLFAEIFLILWILFQYMWDYDVCHKPKFLENKIRYWEGSVCVILLKLRLQHKWSNVKTWSNDFYWLTYDFVLILLLFFYFSVTKLCKHLFTILI